MRRTKVSLGTFLVIGLLGGSTAEGATRPDRFDGQQLFRGLFLAEGPVAHSYPELSLPGRSWDTVPAQQLARKIDELAPGFFVSFQNDVTSGDRLRVEQSTAAAHDLAVKAAAAGPAPDNQAKGAFVVVDKNLFKATHMVVNKNSYWDRAAAHTTTLARERWVNDIAETLAR
ncbi:hypothetical protein [Nonomuraea sp. SYSU D8015]|uniref:hypothetical protein n=1 Tax=Nonomuraea sp. SYSU D8015 TaxID=2593644 RepID=UPI001660EC5E|nr:hypothetical protein [Nonomuraea sp. SYSU D8015]